MQKLSECEELVMAFIWGQDEAQDMSTIMRAVNKKHGKEWKPQTVSTFLTRLVRKEYLASERKGRYTYYHPLVTLEDYRKQRMSEILQLLYGGNVNEARKDLERAEE